MGLGAGLLGGTLLGYGLGSMWGGHHMYGGGFGGYGGGFGGGYGGGYGGGGLGGGYVSVSYITSIVFNRGL